MTAFSFIIPHKNLPSHYLPRLLDSISGRDDMEVIIIDDKSDEKVVDFARLRELANNQIRVVFDKTGLGPGHARNVGIEASCGKWLLFADADDYYEKNELSVFLDHLKNCEADMVYFGANILDLNEIAPRKFCFGFSESTEFVEIKDITPFVSTHHQSWRRALKADFVKKNNLLYPHMRYCEDQSVTVKALLAARLVLLYPKPIYNYIHRATSIIHTLSVNDAKIAYKDSISINRLLKRNNITERLNVMGTILSVIYLHNRLNFYWSVLYEWLMVDYKTMKTDYLSACMKVGANSNLLVAETDALRVKAGKFLRNFRKKELVR